MLEATFRPCAYWDCEASLRHLLGFSPKINSKLPLWFLFQRPLLLSTTVVTPVAPGFQEAPGVTPYHKQSWPCARLGCAAPTSKSLPLLVVSNLPKLAQLESGAFPLQTRSQSPSPPPSTTRRASLVTRIANKLNVIIIEASNCGAHCQK